MATIEDLVERIKNIENILNLIIVDREIKSKIADYLKKVGRLPIKKKSLKVKFLY